MSIRVVPKSEDQNHRIRSILVTIFMFSSLEGKELETVIGAMEERHYQAGDQVIRQGDDGDELYIVGEGALICTKGFVCEAK